MKTLSPIDAFAQRAVALLEALQPLAQLAARLYVAQVFLSAGISKIRDWETTLALFADESRWRGRGFYTRAA